MKTKEEIAAQFTFEDYGDYNLEEVVLKAITQWEEQKWQFIETCPEYEKLMFLIRIGKERSLMLGILTDEGFVDDAGETIPNDMVIAWQYTPELPLESEAV